MLRSLVRHLGRILLTVLLAGLAGATLVRLAPAFGVDEQDLDPRLNRESMAAHREQGLQDGNILQFYARYLGGLAHGDLGWSASLNRPVNELVRERLPVTLGGLGIGVGVGLLAGLGMALLATRFRSPAVDLAPAIASGLCLSIPSAVIALGFLLAGLPGQWALALIVFPYVYRYSRNLLRDAQDAPHVIAARARGIGGTRIVLFHVVPAIGPQLLALVGLAVSIAFPASVPIEVVCDRAGIGQLAWKAAIARDLPVLVSLTMLTTVIVLVGNSFSNLKVNRGAA